MRLRSLLRTILRCLSPRRKASPEMIQCKLELEKLAWRCQLLCHKLPADCGHLVRPMYQLVAHMRILTRTAPQHFDLEQIDATSSRLEKCLTRLETKYRLR